MLLCDDSSEFEKLLTNTARTLNIAAIYIEKDFYALTILKELVSRNDKFIFKGGTSLSVCQHAINRFSEDVDISYEDEHITVGQRKRVKETFFESIKNASLYVENAENIRSRRIFNRYICPYHSIIGNDDKVIVEWATITPSFPIEEKTAQTLIGKYLDSIGRNDLIEKYDLGPFKVKTLTKERTFVDKVFAICDYHISKKLLRQSRHIYDLHKLLEHVSLNQQLIDLFNKVNKYRLNLETCYSAKEGMVLSKLLLSLIKEDTYKDDYNRLTFPLLYDKVTYDTAIKSIEKIAFFLTNHNL